MKKVYFLLLLLAMLVPWAANAQQSLPYSYGFEDNDLSADGWIAQVTSSSSGIKSSANHNGTYGFVFNYSEENGYLLSPILTGTTNGVILSFYYKEYSNSYGDEQFYVGYTTDESNTDPSTYTYGDIVTASTSWQMYEELFPAGTKRVAIKYVFNDAFYLYLDDFTFEAAPSCWDPTGLTATDLTTSSATLGWTSTASNFNVRYRTALIEHPFFFDDFESGLSQWTIYTDSEAPQSNGWYTINPISGLEFEAHSVTSCASSWSWNSSEYDADNWLVSPQVPLTGTLKFWVRTNASYPDQYEVLLSTTTNDESSFTVTLQAMAAAPAVAEWTEVVIDLSAYSGNGYIAIHHVDYDMNYLLIDDFGIYDTPTPAGSWTTTTANTNSLPITGLSTETTYDFEVQANCGSDGTSNWVASTFTTNPSCMPVSNLAVAAATTTSITLSWTDDNSGSATYVVTDNDDNAVSVTGLTTTGCTITGLTANTAYTFKVKANCGGGYSTAETINVRTECNSISTLPYEEDCEADGIYCWTLDGFNILNNSTYTNNGNKCIFNQENNTAYAILPAMADDISGLMLNFWWYNYYAGYDMGTLYVGYLTDASDYTTFTEVGSIDMTTSSSTYAQTIDYVFNGAPAGASIAFKYVPGTYGYIFIDDVTIDVRPACVRPSNLNVTNNGRNSVVTWTSEAGSFDIAYSDDNTAAPANNIIAHPTENTFNFGTVVNLTEGDYYVWVRTNCGSNGYSDWTGPASFHVGYCTPNPTSHDGSGITGVSFGTGTDVVTNGDGSASLPASAPYYGDYTSMIGAVQAGVESTIAITTGTGNYPYTFVIWVDLDNSMSFEDSEILYIGKASSGSGTHNATITIPGSQALGDYRMRIYGADSYFNNFYGNGTTNWSADHDPCSEGYYRHAHDYTVRVLAPPACMAPNGLDATNIMVNSAELSWTANSGETAWTVYYKKISDATYTAISGVTANPYTLNGLEASTNYQFYVEANCTSGTSDPSAVFSFITPCDIYTITDVTSYTQNFEFPVVTSTYSSTTGLELPVCWDAPYTTGTSQAGNPHLVKAGASYNYSTSQVLLFYGSGSNYVTLPEFSNALSELQISFKWATESNSYGTLSLGYITAGDVNYNTFTEIEQYPASSASYHTLVPETVILDTVPATATRLAFRWVCSSQYSCNVDDVEVSLKPTCYKPTAAQADNISVEGATITWTRDTRNLTGETYSVLDEYDNIVTGAENIDDTSFVLTGLGENTPYIFKVRTNCANTSENVDMVSVSFTTLAACPAPTDLTVANITAHTADLSWTGTSGDFNIDYRTAELFNAIYTEGFESGIGEWTKESCATNTGVANSSSYAHSGSAALCFAYNSNPPQYIVSPQLSGITSGMKLQFYYKNTSTSWEETFQVGFSSTDSATSSFAFGTDYTVSDAQWHFYNEDIPAGTKYICFKYNSNDKLRLCIDDIVIGNVIDAGNWTRVTATTTSTQLTNLDPETKYEVRVQRDCGSEGTSQWTDSVTFTTEVACPAPTKLTAGIPSTSSVYLTWIENGSANAWQYSVNNGTIYGTSPAEYQILTRNNDTITFFLNGLNAETTYFVKVRSNCGGNDGVSEWDTVTFTTAANCPVPVLEEGGVTNVTGHTADVAWTGFTKNDSYFVNYRTVEHLNGDSEGFDTGLPDGWTNGSGTLQADGTATITSGSSYWFFNTNCGVFDKHAYFNMYNSKNYWLITPSIFIDNNFTLSFDVAYTKYDSYGSNIAPATGGPHKLYVLISTDNKATWTILREWNNTGSAYVLDEIAQTGQTVNDISLSPYTGQTAFIAFLGVSSTTSYDNNIHIDNVIIGEEIPAGAWQTKSVISNIQTPPSGTVTTTLTGLEPETSYEVYVNGHCTYNDVTTDPTDTLTFTTGVACQAPTDLVVTNTTASTATISWTNNGTSTQWDIFVNNNAVFAQPDINDVTVYGTRVTYTLEGLTAATIQTVKVRANCGGTDGVSAWSNTIAFTTECEDLTTLPYTQDFEEAVIGGSTSSDFVTCMRRLNNGTTYYGYPYVANVSEYNHTEGGSKGLYWLDYFSAGIYGDYQIVVLPGVDINSYAINGLRLKFWAKNYGSSYHPKFIVGVMTNSINPDSFVAVDTINAEATTWTEYVTNLDSYTGQGKYVAIRANRSATDWYAYVDDITLEEIPTCPDVTDVTATPDSLSVTVTWTANGADSYDVELRNGESVVATTNTNENTAIFEDLPINDYQIYIRANCGNDQSPWTSPVNVHIGYCVPAPTSMDGNGITHVTFGMGDNIVNNSVNPSPRYGDYSSQIGAIQAGVESTIAITYGHGYDYGTFIWVDWNNDLDFDDEGEILYYGMSSGESNPHTLSATFTLPATQATGDYRMRIGGSDNGFNTWEEANPCYTDSWACFHDYTLRVLEAPSCLVPNHLAVSDITADGAVLGWNGNGSATEWEIMLNDDDSNLIEVDENPYDLSGLEPNTPYTVKVRSVCGESEYSDWSIATTFLTKCNVFIVDEDNPFTEDFNSSIFVPACWGSIPSSTDDNWSSTTGYNHEGSSGSVAFSGFYGDDYLVMPDLHISEDAAEAQLTFWSLYTYLDYYGGSSLVLLNGSTETELWTPTVNTLDAETWYEETINLNAYIGQTISLAFKYEGDNAHGWYVDDIEVKVMMPHSVYFNEGSGVCETGYLHGTTVTLPVASSDCQTFVGWTTEAVGAETSEPSPLYPGGSSYLITEDHYLYAVYTDGANYTTFPECCTISSLPYERDFEEPVSADAPTPKTEVKPECMIFVHADVNMVDSSKMQLYEGYNHSANGNYSMFLRGRGIFALPKFAVTPAPASPVKLSFYLTQTKCKHQLLVGLMTDLSDESTFTPLATFDNGCSSAMQYYELELASNSSELNGKYIAFRNIINPTAGTEDRSYNWLDDITISLDESTPVECGIDHTYTEDFEGITTNTTASTGIQPECWRKAGDAPALSSDPQLSYGSNGNDSYSLYMSGKTTYVMPQYVDENVSLNTLLMDLTLRQKKYIHQLEVGVMSDPSDESTFVNIATLNNGSVTTPQGCTVDFSGYTGDGHYIAFRNTVVSGYSSDYSYNWIDDISFREKENVLCGIAIRYEQNFDDRTDKTVALTGVQLDCWTVVSETELPANQQPQLYYNSAYAGSGNYSLYMSGKCTYVMPEILTNVNVSDLRMTLTVRQKKYVQELEVGVMNDPNGDFVHVATLNNGSVTTPQACEVDFSSYEGTGKYIAFRNTLKSGYSGNYSYNWIDDIVIDLAPVTTVLVENGVAESEEVNESTNNEEAINAPNAISNFSAAQLSLYPNPTTGKVTLVADEVTMVEVYSQIGSKVATFTLNNEHVIDLGDLPKGVYILRVTMPEGVAVRKVVRN